MGGCWWNPLTDVHTTGAVWGCAGKRLFCCCGYGTADMGRAGEAEAVATSRGELGVPAPLFRRCENAGFVTTPVAAAAAIAASVARFLLSFA